MRGLILSGGSGTRLHPLTKNYPKQLLPVLNKANIIYLIEMLRAADIKEIVVIVGDTYPQVQRLLGNGQKWGVSISYKFQQLPLGLAHAVAIAREQLQDEDFVMLLGDCHLQLDLRDMIDAHIKGGQVATLALKEVSCVKNYGIAYVEGDHIVRVKEKPKGPSSNLAIAGLYIFNHKRIFEAIAGIVPSVRGELEITDAIQWLIDKSYNVGMKTVKGTWIDIGTPLDLLNINFHKLAGLSAINRGILDATSTVLGEVVIEEGVRVVNSILQGPLIIGRDTLVKDSFIGTDTCIGERCEIVKSSMDRSLILSDTSIYNLSGPISYNIIGFNSLLNLKAEFNDSITNIRGRGI